MIGSPAGGARCVCGGVVTLNFIPLLKNIEDDLVLDELTFLINGQNRHSKDDDFAKNK